MKGLSSGPTLSNSWYPLLFFIVQVIPALSVLCVLVKLFLAMLSILDK